ncbi:MAG: hypothetical protein ACPGWS_09780, partial [Solirubrobacterales bacterium]
MRSFKCWKMTPSKPNLAAAMAIAALAVFAAGCGGSVDEALVEEAGVHGDALELVYALYNKDVLEKSSTRDLKDINKALEANDLSQATKGDVRRAQTEIQSRIDELDDYRNELTRANTKLKKTPMPDFAGGLDDDADVVGAGGGGCDLDPGGVLFVHLLLRLDELPGAVVDGDGDGALEVVGGDPEPVFVPLEELVVEDFWLFDLGGLAPPGVAQGKRGLGVARFRFEPRQSGFDRERAR